MDKRKSLSLEKPNYIMLIVALLLVVVGYIFLGAGENIPENTFSTLRVTVAPIVLLVGYGFVVIAIFFNAPHNKKQYDISHLLNTYPLK